MKTFLEEYGLIVLAVIVVTALISLAILFSNRATTNSTSAFDKLESQAEQGLDKISGSGSDSESSSEKH